MKYRTVVVGVIQNENDEYLICKKPEGEGVFPGQWAIPGGGIDDEERMEDAFRREMMEEVGLEIRDIKPFSFRDDVKPKYKGGEIENEIYMIYLVFTCKAIGNVEVDHREFEDFAWVNQNDLSKYDLNEATKETFEKLGALPSKNTHEDWLKYPIGAKPVGSYCNACKRYNVRNSTCTMIGIKDEKVLMVLRATDPQKGFWSFPGGYLSWGETVEECAIREFAEESGCEVSGVNFLGVYSNPDRDLDGRQNVDHCFFGEVGEMVGKSDHEVEKVKWFDLDKLPENIAFDHRQMIEDYILRFRNRE